MKNLIDNIVLGINYTWKRMDGLKTSTGGFVMMLAIFFQLLIDCYGIEDQFILNTSDFLARLGATLGAVGFVHKGVKNLKGKRFSS